MALGQCIAELCQIERSKAGKGTEKYDLRFRFRSHSPFQSSYLLKRALTSITVLDRYTLNIYKPFYVDSFHLRCFWEMRSPTHSINTPLD